MAVPHEKPPPHTGPDPARPTPKSAPREEIARPSAPSDPTGGVVTGIEGMVREIRARLSEISARELELRRREQEFARQYQTLEVVARRAAEREIQQDQDRLERQTSEIRERAAEVAARRLRLDEREERLRERSENLDRQRVELAAQAELLQRRIDSQRSRYADQRETLRQRIEIVRRHEADLAQRIEFARSELAAQRRQTAAERADLEARAQQLRQEQEQLEQARRELEEYAQTREQRSVSLTQERNELAIQRDELERLRDAVAGERVALDRHEQALQRTQEALDRDRAELAKKVQELEDRQRALSDRYRAAEEAHTTSQAQQQTLIARMQEVEAQQHALDEQRAALDRQSAALAEHEREFAERSGQAERQAAEFAHERRRLAEWDAELLRRQDALRTERDAFARQRTELVQQSRALDAQRQAFRDQRVERDQASAATASREQTLAQREQHLLAQHQKLKKRYDALVQREQQLAQNITLLQQQAADLEKERHRLAEWESQLTRRQVDLDESAGRAAEAESHVAALRRDAQSLREQAEVRDRETRQAALTLAVDRQQLDNARAALDAERSTLDADRAALTRRSQELASAESTQQQRLAQARAKLAAQHDRPVPSADARSVRPPRRVLRSTLVATFAAALAAGGWFVTHPTQHLAHVDLRITSASPTAAADHRAALLDPALLDESRYPAALGAAWRALCQRGRVIATVTPAADGPAVLHLTVAGASLADVRAWATQAAAAYAERVNAITADAYVPQPLREVDDWRAQLTSERQDVHTQRDVLHARLAALPDSTARDTCLAEIERLEGVLAETTAGLQQERSSLATLLAIDPPVPVIDPAAVRAALAADTIYQEDRSEFQAVALQYRTELAISMLLLVDPARTLADALAKYRAAIAEQRELAPPEAIAAVLESCDDTLSVAAAQVESFRTQWQRDLETVQNLRVSDDVRTLVERQNAAADAARRLGDHSVQLVDALGRAIEALAGTGEGSTRQVVVAAVLRGEHVTLQTAVEALLEHTGKTAVPENFELDAHDRKLRGLTMRMEQRAAAMTRDLQLESDESARQSHTADIAAARQRVAALERAREQQMAELSAQLRQRSQLDALVREREDVTAQLARLTEHDAWLAERIRTLDATLDQARRHAQPDRVSVSPARLESRDHDRLRQTALAAGTTFLAAWLLALLSFTGLRRVVAQTPPSPARSEPSR